VKLVHPEIETHLIFEENQVLVWTIEHKHKFYDYVTTLQEQIDHHDEAGTFVLSENTKILPLHKHAVMLSNPFLFDIGQRKIQQAFLELLEKEALENHYLQVSEIYRQLSLLLQDLDVSFGGNMTYHTDIDVKGLLKLCKAAPSLESDSVVERLINFTEIVQELQLGRLLVLVNFMSVMTDEEKAHLYQYITSKKMAVLLIEPHTTEKLKYEKQLFLDQDLCEIIV